MKREKHTAIGNRAVDSAQIYGVRPYRHAGAIQRRGSKPLLPWFPLRTFSEAEAYLYGQILPEYQKEIAYRYAVVYKAGQQVGRLRFAVRR